MKRQTTILDLPSNVIDKIMFERWIIDKKIKNVLSFLYTCKFIYNNHKNIIFKLTPLTLGLYKNYIDDKIIQSLVENNLVKRINSVYAYPKCCSNYISLFKNLRIVSISTSFNDLLQIIERLPKTTTILSITLTKISKDIISSPASIPNLSLKYLKFNSLKCIKRADKRSILKHISNNSTTDSLTNYYQQNSPAKQISKLIATLIKENISTLQNVSMECISLTQIYLALVDSNFKFEIDKMIDTINFDQTTHIPLINCEKWLKVVSKLIYINNYLSLTHTSYLVNGVVCEEIRATNSH
ncbi:hypothetical protein KGF54_000683 [Candida jiufengensis]|uniref:uncharacterized protein n=1 Tax=Candida jiufengensis TaxID=497108 RepID=UPI002224A085|nr:uncharacterized protein KGF54_000683 [Candida jiufengensis]KAI5956208.1 hypothetical protein KGF54_000683 [Candida jiufengensis]